MKKYFSYTIEGTEEEFNHQVVELQERIEKDIQAGGKRTFEAFTSVCPDERVPLMHTYHVQGYVWESDGWESDRID